MIVTTEKLVSTNSEFRFFQVQILLVTCRRFKIVRTSWNGPGLLTVNNRKTRTRCEICSKLTTKTAERRLKVNNIDNRTTCLVSLLLTLNILC